MAEIATSGIFLLSFASASLNLRILAGPEVEELVKDIAPDGWYPQSRFNTALSAVSQRFTNFGPALERIGEEMMRLWYTQGPGAQIVKTGVEFLRFQTGSEGYRSVVRGEPSAIGDFALEHLDEAKGVARVRSTTPFDRTMERGVLIGGMRLPGDLVFVGVDNSADPSVFEIRFH